MIVHEARKHEVREGETSGRAKDLVLVLFHLGPERAVITGPPVGDKLVQRAWVEDQAGENVRADLAALLKHDTGALLALLLCQLHETDCGAKACRPSADHHKVIFHGFALNLFRHSFLPLLAPLAAPCV